MTYELHFLFQIAVAELILPHVEVHRLGRESKRHERKGQERRQQRNVAEIPRIPPLKSNTGQVPYQRGQYLLVLVRVREARKSFHGDNDVRKALEVAEVGREEIATTGRDFVALPEVEKYPELEHSEGKRVLNSHHEILCVQIGRD